MFDYPDLSAAQSSLLRRAVAERRSVPPEQAIASVRRFVGDPGLALRVSRFEDGPTLTSSEWTWFELETQDESRSTYRVRARDGRVFEMFDPRASNPSDTRTLPLEQARQAALAFILSRYPEFTAGPWNMSLSDGGHIGDYKMAWWWVLNRHGTLAPHPLWVTVNGVTGEICAFHLPPDRISGPTVPRISPQQAARIAAAIAPFDPRRASIGAPILRMTEDPFGIQSLTWEFFQRPAPTEQKPEPAGVYLLVSAVNGASAVLWPLGGSPDVKGNRRLRPLSDAPRPVRIRKADGEPVSANAAPELQNGRVWIRAELLRALEVPVYLERENIRVRAGERLLPGAELQAERRDSGWWLPLRSAAAALGWTLTWNARNREVVVGLVSRGEDARVQPASPAGP